MDIYIGTRFILIDLSMGWVLGVLALLALIKQTLLALVGCNSSPTTVSLRIWQGTALDIKADSEEQNLMAGEVHMQSRE